jgi:hypothetical protein
VDLDKRWGWPSNEEITLEGGEAIILTKKEGLEFDYIREIEEDEVDDDEIDRYIQDAREGDSDYLDVNDSDGFRHRHQSEEIPAKAKGASPERTMPLRTLSVSRTTDVETI